MSTNITRIKKAALRFVALSRDSVPSLLPLGIRGRRSIAAIAGVAAIIAAALAIVFAMGYENSQSLAGAENAAGAKKATQGEIMALMNRNRQLKNRLGELKPAGTYIVVDTAANHLYLYRNGKAIHKAVISSGSGNILEEPGGDRKWVFDTPRGEYAVNSKLRDPDWIKPDWAFIEETEEIPARQSDRVVSGVLGDYALGFGNGYFIHGTLYTRLLGRNITHGCIRAANEDLKVLFKYAAIGTKIYIF